MVEGKRRGRDGREGRCCGSTEEEAEEESRE